MQDRFLKRLRKKARKGMRGWPAATIAFYGPDLDRASKVAVGIVPYEAAEVTEMRAWELERPATFAPTPRSRKRSWNTSKRMARSPSL